MQELKDEVENKSAAIQGEFEPFYRSFANAATKMLKIGLLLGLEKELVAANEAGSVQTAAFQEHKKRLAEYKTELENARLVNTKQKKEIEKVRQALSGMTETTLAVKKRQHKVNHPSLLFVPVL